jgi:hypothetical protein
MRAGTVPVLLLFRLWVLVDPCSPTILLIASGVAGDGFAKEDCCLWVVVEAFAWNVSTIAIESDGDFEAVVAIEVDPTEAFAAGEVFLCFEQLVCDAMSAGVGLDVEALTFAGERNGAELSQQDTADGLVIQVGEPHAGARSVDDLLDCLRGVALDDVYRFVVLLQQPEGVVVGFCEVNDAKGMVLGVHVSILMRSLQGGFFSILFSP